MFRVRMTGKINNKAKLTGMLLIVLLSLGLAVFPLTSVQYKNGALLRLKLCKQINCEYSEIDWRAANLNGVDLGGLDLSWTNFKNANLQGVSLKNANLLEANLEGANLRGANLLGVQLTGASYDENTRWPDGFQPPQNAVMNR